MIDIINRAEDEFPSLLPLLQEFFDGLSIPASSLPQPRRSTLKILTYACAPKSVADYLSMFGVTTSDDYRPVAWMGRFPVDVTTILVGIHVALAIVACLLVAAGGGGLLDLMMFDSARVLGSGQVWRLATYAFIHSPMQLLWFAIEMYMLFVFGREVEKFIGQRAYIVSLCGFTFHAFASADTLGIQPTDWTGRLARIAFRSFCRLRHHLSIGRDCFCGSQRNGRQ